MHSAGCLRCHGDGQRISYFENDWINLQTPEHSRILRAPLPQGSPGLGLGLCRDRRVDPARQRIHLLWNGYAHAVLPPEAFPKRPVVPYDPSGQPVASFASAQDIHYQTMLGIIREAREKVLANPRVDMPGAEVVPGACRMFLPPPVPAVAPAPHAELLPEGVVRVSWERSARTIGLDGELHRSDRAEFTPDAKTRLVTTPLAEYVDSAVPLGRQYYALVLVSGDRRSQPACVSVDVTLPPPPPAPAGVSAAAASSAVRLRWLPPAVKVAGYHVYRGPGGSPPAEKLSAEPVRTTVFSDGSVQDQVKYAYAVRAISLRGVESPLSATVEATARIVKEPVFTLELDKEARGLLTGGAPLASKLQKPAQIAGGVLDVRQGGHVSFPHHAHFDLAQPLTVECWVRFDEPGQMPVVIGCGLWHTAGWFLQKLGGVWRWHVGGVDCDGGRPEAKRWLHVVATYDGRTARLFQDGQPVAEATGTFVTAPYAGELCVGQYSPQPAPPYQVAGRIAGVKLYHRALTAAEAAAAARSKDGLPE
jgi:hypothetical protein